MSDQSRDALSETLERIADALERLAPPAPVEVDWLNKPAFTWDSSGARALDTLDAPGLEQLRTIERQKALILDNVERLAAGHAAHDMLLWGSRGMGKSALLKAVTKEVQKGTERALALVQVAPDALDSLPDLFKALAALPRQFVIFIDDLGFADNDSTGPRKLRSWLEGGVEARSSNCRLAVTSNRRAILPRQLKEQDPDSGESAINMRDTVDDKLALADRFGLSVGFHACSKIDYLEIIRSYADPLELAFSEEEAVSWALARGQRSGRVAWQFVVELAGKAGKTLG